MGVPVGIDQPLWYSPRVWEPSSVKEYKPPHEEEENYASALPYVDGIREKFVMETSPDIDRMGGPIHG